jgi:hypothetical protein
MPREFKYNQSDFLAQNGIEIALTPGFLEGRFLAVHSPVRAAPVSKGEKTLPWTTQSETRSDGNSELFFS